MKQQIWVFGSNRAGRHGKGSALEARQKHGAIYGQGEGLQGQSYGIPTKDKNIQTLPLSEIKPAVDRFLAFAVAHPEMEFHVVKIGTMLAGYQDSDIAPFFVGHPENVKLHEDWVRILSSSIAKQCTVVHISKAPPGAIYMGRAGKGMLGPYGNPYIIGKHGVKGECVKLFEAWLREGRDPTAIAYLERVKNGIKRGDVLTCFCHDRPCHAWVIADYVNNGYQWEN